jgi:hypothetical protein
MGRSNLVGLRHIDEFNHSAGRNLGFRKGVTPSSPSNRRLWMLRELKSLLELGVLRLGQVNHPSPQNR